MTLVYLALTLATGFLLSRFVIPRSRSARSDREARTREVIENIKAGAEFALYLVPQTEPGMSRLGGVPDMAKDGEWPIGPDGVLGFIGQFDLAAARQAGGPKWLPVQGLLQAFHDGRWGEADQVRVLLIQESELSRGAQPADLREDWRYHELPIGFDRHPSLPSLEWIGIDPRAVSPSGGAWAELAEISGPRPEIVALHQIGGYPDEIQPECLPRSAASNRTSANQRNSPWKLLLQIDTDERTGMAWADGGRLYVLISEADARAGDFSQTVTIAHTY